MRLSPKYLCALSVLSLAVAATAHADTIINFSPAVGSPTPFTSYTTGIFTVTQGVGQFDLNPNQGDPPPGITGGMVLGHATSSVILTDGGAGFDFVGFDLDAYTSPVSYTLTGTYKGVTVFSGITGTDSTTGTGSGHWVTVDPSGVSGIVDTVTLSFTDSVSGTQYSVDNIDAITPEPSSLILAGTGLLGLGAAIRRRLAV